MQFSILNRWSGEVQFTAEIDANESDSIGFKIGLSVEWAIKNKANLQSANLQYANLRFANLRFANLQHANLQHANLQYANLQYADLRFAKNSELAIAQTRIIPDCGDIIGWKKCRNGVIVKLLIKDGTKRSHAFGRNCRAEQAEVVELFGGEEGVSQRDPSVIYRKGETVKCDSWEEDFKIEFGGGIHFFISKIEAENY